MARRRSLTSTLYRAARLSNDVRARREKPISFVGDVSQARSTPRELSHGSR